MYMFWKLQTTSKSGLLVDAMGSFNIYREECGRNGFWWVILLRITEYPSRLIHWIMDNFNLIGCELVLAKSRFIHIDNADVDRVTVGNRKISMSIDLVLKPSCSGCGSTVELYGSMCKHLTLCVNCGKTMAENRAKCYECGNPITRLIREYNVRACSSSDKNYFIGRFATGLPNFKKKNENKWALQKEGNNPLFITSLRYAMSELKAVAEKYKNKPWLLEDETGQFQYHGKEFVAIPAGSWYNFNKVAQYKQLTLEEAEEKMKNRTKTADGYQRWMMKAANNGAAAFGEVEKSDDKESAAGGGRGVKRPQGMMTKPMLQIGRRRRGRRGIKKNRLGLNKKGGDDDEEGPRGGDLDFDDDDIEKGDDWEHEEIFTDDDEAVGNDPEEREDLAPEIPAPPEIKQKQMMMGNSYIMIWVSPYFTEDLMLHLPSRLSKSGKELKKLLGRANGLNDSDAEDDDGLRRYDISPVLAPKKEAPKEEPVDNSPLKSTTSGTGRGTPSTSKSSKEKEKVMARNQRHLMEVKSVKDEPASSTKSSVPTKGASPSASSKSGSAPPSGPVTEDEIRTVLLQKTPVTTHRIL
ncbi:hypothetical protein DH2020_017210 [Rehmannia glutinosa]|uniref:Transcription initiation factor IIF subunit alpha n=1 Tax=Rehmannia glutinosa TaxID=99300 RepID=A0ABR0WUH3_REHGL